MTQVERRIKKDEGFSLIEVLISMVLIAVAMLGLAQLFTYSIQSNSRADKMTSSTFLAQQQIDALRSLTSEELSALSSPLDEALDVNGDGTIDFRRVTALQSSGTQWDIKVLLFPGSQTGATVTNLLQNPQQYHLRAEMGTIISR
ncbi:MAG: prepilin-type N-terminal cleavage/methylation domain-containing protein [Candidatus Aminicenantes bacterium]|nr:prepilin-type N-terminal cleavage/methylation domain-containing protein [Candidatus Aminicenantes bacterium]